MKSSLSVKQQFLLLLLSFFPVMSFAQGAGEFPDMGQMFANFSEASVSLMNLLRWSAWLIGIIITYLGLVRLKEYSESPGRVKISNPIMLTCVGALLIALPGSVDMATETLSLGSNTGVRLLSEPNVGGDIPGLNEALTGVLLFIKMVGHIAFIKGLLIFKRIGEGDQQAGTGRGLTHLLGGAAAININATINMFGSTFAPGFGLGGLGG